MPQQPEHPRSTTERDAPTPGRPWLGVRFDCCGAYQRAYLAADGSAYNARCPRCLRPARFRVGDGGTSARMFVAR